MALPFNQSFAAQITDNDAIFLLIRKLVDHHLPD
jgi:hypothetical protein